VFATRDDHIVPWQSAARTPALLGGAATFVLGASGHIAGVVNPPAGGKRNYWTSDASIASPDEWVAGATSHAGSWWSHWYDWLAGHSGGRRAAPRACGNAAYPPLGAAPGRYVVEKSG
jgi:polyhydroxyalkanoate synthase